MRRVHGTFNTSYSNFDLKVPSALSEIGFRPHVRGAVFSSDVMM
jgi:hypothetical protein